MSSGDTARPIVVVDSNTIVQNAWWLDSPAWTVLLHQARAEHIRLIVPELVIRESLGKYRESVVAGLVASRNAASKLARLTHEEYPAADTDEIDRLVGIYEAHLRSRLGEFGVEVAAVPEADVAKLAQWAIDRRRPFNSKGSGFRDALLWETIADLATSGDVHLVSNDSSAFASAKAEDASLHPDLVRDLADRAEGASVVLHELLSSYLSASGVEDPPRLAHLYDDLSAANDSLGAAIAADLRGSAIGGHPAVTAQVVEVHHCSVSLGRASNPQSEGEPTFVALDVGADVEVEVVVGDGDPETFSTTLRLAGSVTYDPESREFGTPLVEAPDIWSSEQLSEAMRELLSPSVPLALSPETLEAIRRASQIKIPPEAFEAFRRASQFKIPPETFEAFRRASQIKIPPETFEAFRRASQIRLPPGFWGRTQRAPKQDEPSGPEDEASGDASPDSDDDQSGQGEG